VRPPPRPGRTLLIQCRLHKTKKHTVVTVTGMTRTEPRTKGGRGVALSGYHDLPRCLQHVRHRVLCSGDRETGAGQGGDTGAGAPQWELQRVLVLFTAPGQLGPRLGTLPGNARRAQSLSCSCTAGVWPLEQARTQIGRR